MQDAAVPDIGPVIADEESYVRLYWRLGLLFLATGVLMMLVFTFFFFLTFWNSTDPLQASQRLFTGIGGIGGAMVALVGTLPIRELSEC
jgi:hypothetical protein